MYTKIFRSIYDGTLADNWKALVTFQQLLILSNEEGVVDMTLSAIARTTGLPMDILQEGIRFLEQPDPQSRSHEDEGRRILRMEAHRDWGWLLVNFKKYRQLQTREHKLEADRVRIAKKRASQADVARCREVSHVVADVAHTDTEAYTDTKKKPTLPSPVGDSVVSSSKDAKRLAKERLTRITMDAITTWNASPLVKPLGKLDPVNPEVGLPTWCEHVARCLPTAEDILRAEGGDTEITTHFWEALWDLCHHDDYKSGRKSYSEQQSGWRPDLEYLTRPKVILSLYTKSPGTHP